VSTFTTTPSAWELTSGEFEMETDTDEPPTEQHPQRGSLHHDASHHASSRLAQADHDGGADALEPVMSEPFPLLRPAAPGGSRSGPDGSSRR
jgi:hypothetical protein